MKNDGGAALRFDAYYFCFKETGAYAIDLILAAVAAAGKAYHHTEDWNTDTGGLRPGIVGKTPVDWIQNAANEAAAMLAAREGKDG